MNVNYRYWYYFHFLGQGLKFASNCQDGYGSSMCDKHWYSISSVYQYDKGRKTDQNLKTFTFRHYLIHHEQICFTSQSVMHYLNCPKYGRTMWFSSPGLSAWFVQCSSVLRQRSWSWQHSGTSPSRIWSSLYDF